jgi:hypothetical protein
MLVGNIIGDVQNYFHNIEAYEYDFSIFKYEDD